MGICNVAASKLASAVSILACCAVAAESSSNKVTRVTSFQASSALATFQIESGFKVELVAAEPLVTSPVAIAFDENGRLFVAEMAPGSEGADRSKGQGQIRLLDDPDAGGQFRTSTVYSENLDRPSALACYAGGLFVASAGEILYVKDTSGDGIADVRRPVLSGFGGTDGAPLKGLLNNFNWGLSGRIYGATAGIGGSITASNWPTEPVSIDGRDFSFEPRSLAVFPDAGPAQSGTSFDARGRKFSCDSARPLRLAMYESRYWARNPFYVPAPELVDVTSPATIVFRADSAAVPQAGVSQTNSVVPGWLVNAQGMAIYRGSLFGTNYAQNAFVCDPEMHLVHRMLLQENGLETIAARPPNERNSEFLVSRDPSFRPVQAVNGPDGALYIVDRQESEQQGRIYRIVPEGFNRPKPPHLASAKIYDLVAGLANRNGWYSDTAARLVFERQDASAVPLLGGMLTNSALPFARRNALYALAVLGYLDESHVLKGLQDTDAGVREHAVLVSEALMPNGAVSAALWYQLRLLASDPAIRVRYQLAFTIGVTRRPDRHLVLAQILSRDPTNEWIQNAVLSSLGDGAGTFFAYLGSDARFRSDAVGLAFLRRVAELIGNKGRLDEVGQAVDFIAAGPRQPLEAFALTYALGEGLRRTRSGLALVDIRGQLQNTYTSALALAIDFTVPEAVRIEAIRTLSVSPYTFNDTADWLLAICDPQPSTALRSAALEALGRLENPRLLPALLEHWRGLTPSLRRQAVRALLSRTSRVPALLTAVEKGAISPADLSSISLNFLRTFPDPGIRERANRLFGPVPVRRPEAITQFKSALALRGAAEHGRDLFVARCSDCHSVGGRGQSVGPDLTGAKTGGREKILSAILEPSAAITPEYETCILETQEGENLIGIKSEDNPISLTLRQPDAAPAVWPRVNIRSTQTRSWSLMPEGLEQGLSTQDMADLLEYLMTKSTRN